MNENLISFLNCLKTGCCAGFTCFLPRNLTYTIVSLDSLHFYHFFPIFSNFTKEIQAKINELESESKISA